MKKEMLINVLQPEECRIAIVEDGTLEELYVERASQESYVNNIYKGRIVNIEPSIQAAFVDFGIGRNGFLHVSDVDPVYYKHLDTRGSGGRDDRNNDRGHDRRNDRGDRDRDNRNSPRGGRGGGGGDRQRERRPFEPVVIPDVENLPPEYEEMTAAPQEMTSWLEPPAPPMSPAAREFDDDGFGAGLLDDLPPTDRRHETPSSEDLAPASSDAEEQASTEVEAPAETPRRRASRARTPRRKPEAAEAVEQPRPRRRTSKKKNDVADEPASEASSAEAGEAHDGDKPRVMGSAERRTSGHEPELDTEFGGSGIVFDPFAPNDRFQGKASAKAAPPTEEIELEEDDIVEGEAPDTDAEPFEDEPEGTGLRSSSNQAAIWMTMTTISTWTKKPPAVAIKAVARRDRGGPRGGPRGGQRRTFSRDGGRPKPPIQEILKRGQEVIVQVIKEGIGTKGPTLSTYISIAGRYLVLMPSLNRVAVSRKILDEDVRIRLKESLTQLNPPKGIGFIIRTAAIDRNKAELRNDLSYLVRLWEVFSSRVLKRPAPVEIYRESDMITRTIRDIFTADIDSIYVDEANAYTQAAEFLKIVMPRYADRIKHYADTEPIFTRFKIDNEIARINEKKIPLPMGGSIVIEQTEALVAIDVNSGNFRAENNAEETAYRMNLQAATEIGRQLRLRDLGGVIVNDFIDMKEERHRRAVEQALRNALRRDRARTKILKTSAFGVIEMTRQRIRPSLKRSIYQECTHCRATSFVKTSESMSIEIMRLFQLAAHRKTIRNLQAKVHADVASYLLNKKRKEISHWEEIGQMQVTISGLLGVSPEFLELQGFDNNGNEVKVVPVEPVRMIPDRRPPHQHDDRGGRSNDRGRRGGRGGKDRD